MATKEEQDKARQEQEQKAKDQAEQQKTQQAAQRQDQPKGDRSPAQQDADLRTGRSRGGVTEAQAEEVERVGTNVALDNRTGDQRPPREEWPAKPQQVDGPEVGHFAEHAEDTKDVFEKFRTKVDNPAGLKSEGPLGLGPAGTSVGGDDPANPPQ